MKNTVRRINVNLTAKEDAYLEWLVWEKSNRAINFKVSEADIVREALAELAKARGYNGGIIY